MAVLLLNILLGALCLSFAAGVSAQVAAETGINNPIREVELSTGPNAADFQQCMDPNTPLAEDKLRNCEAALASSNTPLAKAHILAVMSKLSLQQGQQGIARKHIEDALTLAPDDPMVLNNWGSVLIRQNSFAAATDAFSKGLQSTQQADLAAILHHNRSMALRALGDFGGAAADYAEYIRLLDLAATSTPLQDTSVLNDAPIQSGFRN